MKYKCAIVNGAKEPVSSKITRSKGTFGGILISSLISYLDIKIFLPGP